MYIIELGSGLGQGQNRIYVKAGRKESRVVRECGLFMERRIEIELNRKVPGMVSSGPIDTT